MSYHSHVTMEISRNKNVDIKFSVYDTFTYRNQNHHDINEILLKVAFNNIKPTIEINDNILYHALHNEYYHV
jgi:hypothetical protein